MLDAQCLMRMARYKPRRWAFCMASCALGISLLSAACATAPPAPSAVKPPVVTWEEKLGWILRLEDQRILRDPNPPAPVILVPAAKGRPAIVAPPPPSDLLRLITDEEARTLHPHGWKNVTPYMRVTRHPGLDQSSETRATERQPA